MKKLLRNIALVLALVMMSCTLFACGSDSQHEEKFIGKWATHSGGNTVIYSFYEENGVYKATCMTSGYKMYEFDKYTATNKTITLYQNGTSTKYYYSFEDGYLYMDGLEFEPFN